MLYCTMLYLDEAARKLFKVDEPIAVHVEHAHHGVERLVAAGEAFEPPNQHLVVSVGRNDGTWFHVMECSHAMWCNAVQCSVM